LAVVLSAQRLRLAYGFSAARIGVGREVTVSDVTAILAMAGFGMVGGFGAAVRYFVDLLQANARLDGRGPYIP